MRRHEKGARIPDWSEWKTRDTSLLAHLDLVPAASACMSLGYCSRVAHIELPPDKRKGMRAELATHCLTFLNRLDAPRRANDNRQTSDIALESSTPHLPMRNLTRQKRRYGERNQRNETSQG